MDTAEAGRDRPSMHACTVYDDSGRAGSTWPCELPAGDDPGSTIVRHSFTHRPGVTGTWVAAQADPGALNRRLVMLCQRVTTTIAAMVTTEKEIGATR